VSNWKTVRLSEIAESVDYGVTASATQLPNGPKFLRITDIQKGDVNWDSVPWCDCDINSVAGSLLRSGDIVFARTGATTGKSFLIRECQKDTIFASYLIRVRVSSLAEPRYVSHYFQTPSYWAQIAKSARGVAQPGVNATTLRSLEIPLPPLEEQKRIADILDRAEALRAKRRVALSQIDELTRSIFIDMFGDLIENPMKWDLKKIDDIAEVKTGGTPSRNNEEYWQNGTLPWVKTTEIRENIISEIEEYITESGFQNSNATLLPQNSILIAMYGQGKTRGRTAKLGIQATTNQACAAILPSDKYETDFLWTFLRLSYDALRNLGRGGNQPNLNLSMIKDFKIYFPPIEKQKLFSEVLDNIEKIKLSQKYSLLEINNLFDALMHEAFTGKLFSHQSSSDK
jgi:type I restriction enzyme, S subunit